MSFGPFCYMPRARRGYFKSLEVVFFAEGGLQQALRQLHTECNVRVFAGRRENRVVWIVAYNMPRNAGSSLDDQLITFRRNEQNLIIIPIRGVWLNFVFTRQARQRALSEFAKSREN